jgi:hypothetical protein
MARKATVDKEVILTLLKEGETTQSIAGRFGVSRQAIDLHRKEFIKQGLLPDQRAARTRRAVREPLAAEVGESPLKRTPPPETPLPETGAASVAIPEDIVSLDRQIDLIIAAFGALRRLPGIEAELGEYKQKYEQAMQEIGQLRQAAQKRRDQEQRWLMAHLKGEAGNDMEHGAGID